MSNAKTEFLGEVEGKTVKCAVVKYGAYELFTAEYFLQCNYTRAEYDAFLQSLDFEYHDGFGTQELFGTIWYTDGTWSERYEYDGRENWVQKEIPVIPPDLIRTVQ